MAPPYYEDVDLGRRLTFEERHDLTEAEIVAFGERFEPWVHHVDPDRADESDYVHRLTAGTLHVAAAGVRLFHDAYLADSGALDLVGVTDLWREYQVHPGDTLGVAAEAVDVDPLSDVRGTVAYDVTVFEADEDVTVLSMTVRVAFRRRADDEATDEQRGGGPPDGNS